jgi:hypothetical protein
MFRFKIEIKTLPAQLKICSLCALVPCMHKYFMANFANVGNSVWNVFHHCNGLQFKPTLGKDKYFSCSIKFKSCKVLVSTCVFERLPKKCS